MVLQILDPKIKWLAIRGSIRLKSVPSFGLQGVLYPGSPCVARASIIAYPMASPPLLLVLSSNQSPINHQITIKSPQNHHEITQFLAHSTCEAAVFICGVGATIDLVGASVDYRSTMRSKVSAGEAGQPCCFTPKKHWEIEKIWKRGINKITPA